VALPLWSSSDPSCPWPAEKGESEPATGVLGKLAGAEEPWLYMALANGLPSVGLGGSEAPLQPAGRATVVVSSCDHASAACDETCSSGHAGMAVGM
jgi:hypothetical protein